VGDLRGGLLRESETKTTVMCLTVSKLPHLDVLEQLLCFDRALWCHHGCEAIASQLWRKITANLVKNRR
jgi:hypothetical protein